MESADGLARKLLFEVAYSRIGHAIHSPGWQVIELLDAANRK
jgi:hypothetical protein